MASRRYGRGIWSPLAASLLIHGIAVGGLVLSARFLSADPGGAAPAAEPGGAGGIVFVRLLDVSAAPSQALTADDGVSTPAAGARPIPPKPLLPAAPARRAKPRPDSGVPAAAPLQTEEPAELASALPPTSPPGDRPPAEAGTPASQSPGDTPSGARVPDGGPLASARLGPGSGYEAGRIDRAARPAAPIRPHYPARARQRGDEADVAVDVWVGSGGEVDRVAIASSAGAEFDAAAVAAVNEARFHPALRDGEQVPSRVALRLHFRLDR